VNGQARICDIEAKGERTVSSDKNIDTIFLVPDSDVKFEIEFLPKGAKIKMASEGSNGCGMNAYFDGKWTKDRSKIKKK